MKRARVLCFGLALLVAGLCLAAGPRALGASGASGASSDDSRLARAEAAFAAGRCEESLELLRAALAAGEGPPGALLENMGICALHLGRPAEAVLHLRRAARHRPRDTELQATLATARARLGLAAPRAEEPSVLLRRALETFTPREHLLFAATLQAAGLIVWLLGAPRSGRRRLGAGLILLALLSAGRLAWDALVPPPADGVVLAAHLPVRAAPEEGGELLFTLRAGDEITVSARSETWLFLRHARGVGWAVDEGLGWVE